MKKNNRHTDYNSENTIPDTSELEQLIDNFLSDSQIRGNITNGHNTGLGLRRLEQLRENAQLHQEITDIFGADADNDADIKKAS